MLLIFSEFRRSEFKATAACLSLNTFRRRPKVYYFESFSPPGTNVKFPRFRRRL